MASTSSNCPNSETNVLNQSHSDLQPSQAQRSRQHASFSGRAASAVESQGLTVLQLNVEGLTTAKLSVLEHVATTNKATVVLLQETHKESDTILKLPGFTLAGYTKCKHHGLASFVISYVSWSHVAQSADEAEVDWITTKVQDTTVVNVYKPPPSRLSASVAARCYRAQLCKPATSTAVTQTGGTTTPTRTSWSSGHPPSTPLCYLTPKSQAHFTLLAGIVTLTQTWHSLRHWPTSHCPQDATWTDFLVLTTVHP